VGLLFNYKGVFERQNILMRIVGTIQKVPISYKKVKKTGRLGVLTSNG